jgi:hypothetical protein
VKGSRQWIGSSTSVDFDRLVALKNELDLGDFFGGAGAIRAGA